MITLDERVDRVAALGFTSRQARFLVTVMLFSGVCVPKQYARFAGTAYGQNVNEFFARLVRRGFATRCACVHNRASLFHVQSRPLYEAIGFGRSRYRLPVPAARVIERLTRLDAALCYPELRWLAGEQDKVDFVRATLPDFGIERLPQVMVGRRVRLFPNDVAIGLDVTGQPHLLYLVSRPFEDDFRAFLRRYCDLLGALPYWTLRLLFVRVLESAVADFQAAFHDELFIREESGPRRPSARCSDKSRAAGAAGTRQGRAAPTERSAASTRDNAPAESMARSAGCTAQCQVTMRQRRVAPPDDATGSLGRLKGALAALAASGL